MPASSASTPLGNHTLAELRKQVGLAVQENVSLAGHTTGRVGGPADALLVVQSANELERAARALWKLDLPFLILGSGSNILVSDEGLHAVVILNRARTIKIDEHSTPASIWAESGANFGTIARQAALRGLSGLEWAATIPGTLGGAVYGNAGAYGSDMSSNLLLADILHPDGKESWTVEQMAYRYRSSALKRGEGLAQQSKQGPSAIILSARLKVEPGDPQAVQAKMEANAAHRRRTQPPGASMGSMFKNPPGDYAGRLIEAAGLKGLRVGNAEISPVHANFFINHGSATASEIGQLIQQARKAVYEQFGVVLNLEVELLGSWPAVQTFTEELV